MKKTLLTFLLLLLGLSSFAQKREAFFIDGPNGKLSAELIYPRNFNKDTDHCDLVITMHGFLGGKNKAPMEYVAQTLTGGGYAVLRFDFDSYGSSDGRQEDNTIPKMLDDAKAVWDYASTLPFAGRKIILGHSQGGLIAGMLAGRLQKALTPPDAVILMAPALNIKKLAKEGKFFSVSVDPQNPPESVNVYGFKLGKEYILTAQTLPIEEESSLYTGPVCLIHGTRDKIVPSSVSEFYHNLFSNNEVHYINGADHIFLARRGFIRKIMLDFLSNSPKD